jgi:hypothetical protein
MKNFVSLSKSVFALALVLGVSTSSAHARLIFTTEEDGTPATSWTIDQGDIYNNVDLNFGTTGVGINYNFTNGYFTFSDEVQMQIQNNAGVPNTCTTTDAGQMYFDSSTTLLYFCNGTSWTTTNNSSTLSLNDGQFLVGNNVNTATAVTPTGDITFDNAGVFDITADAVTTAEVLDGSLSTIDFADNSITLGKIADGPVNQVMTTDASGNPVWESRVNFVSNTLPDGQFLVGDSSNTAVAVAPTGDVTFDNTGAFDITNDAVTTAEILDNTLTFDDLAVRESVMTESPEFSNFTLQASGSNNRGTLESDHDSAVNKNFYKWSTRQNNNIQSYDIVMQWAIPENFQGFSTTANAPIEVDFKTNTTASTENALTVSIEDSAGNILSTTSNNLVSSTANTWVENQAVNFTGGTFTPGEYLTLRFAMTSQATTTSNQNPVFVGPVKFNYTAK